MSTLLLRYERYREFFMVFLCGVLILVAWLIEKPYPSLAIAVLISAFVIGGFMKAKEGLLTLIEEKEIDVNFLMILAAIGAASIGYWLEGAMLILIFAISGALESYVTAKSERDLTTLLKMQPETATLIENGCERSVAVEHIRVHDCVLVRPGERIPVDGKVLEGISFVNQAMITGESLPVEKKKGDMVYAGTMNQNGSLMIQVTHEVQQTVLARILRLIEQAKKELPVSQQKIERFEKIYAKIILGLTLLIMLIPYLFFHWTWTEAFYRAMVFLVVASPCAVVASIMPAILATMSHGARKGVLFKNGKQLERLADVQVVAFDKTGTLTKGELEVTSFEVFHPFSKEEILVAVGAIESLSEHLLAKSLVRYVQEQGISFERAKALTAVTGYGVKAEYQGKEWKIGSYAFVQEELGNRLDEPTETTVYVVCDHQLAGLFTLHEVLRPETKSVVHELKKQGFQVMMLTGDRKLAAKKVAHEAGIEKVHCELLPEEKVEKIKQYSHILMVGDGVNDAPALATADLGVAMGGIGSDTTLQTADVILMKDDLRKLLYALKLGRRMKRIIIQNLVFALSVIGLLVFSNVWGLINLPVGVLGHEGSTLLVILNSLRLLR